ncbi:MAG: hypothetical protein LBJ32_02640 [Oscillospiraceae bacterium]|jgi:hypothetical protein|nr:hypothetical protein [Oscillospiraceae bacterium]
MYDVGIFVRTNNRIIFVIVNKNFFVKTIDDTLISGKSGTYFFKGMKINPNSSFQNLNIQNYDIISVYNKENPVFTFSRDEKLINESDNAQQAKYEFTRSELTAIVMNQSSYIGSIRIHNFSSYASERLGKLNIFFFNHVPRFLR